MNITELLSWLAGGPDFGPFASLKVAVVVVFGIVLAIVALAGLAIFIRGFAVWGTCGKNRARRQAGIDDMEQGAKQFIVVLAFGTVLTILGAILAQVFGALGSVAAPAEGVVLLMGKKWRSEFGSNSTTEL